MNCIALFVMSAVSSSATEPPKICAQRLEPGLPTCTCTRVGLPAPCDPDCCIVISAVAADSGAVRCTGSNDPVATAPLCYEGVAGALGLKETVSVKIANFAAEKGTLDLTGTGITAFTCTSQSFSKSGQAITTDLSNCLPRDVVLDGVKYCSDQDTLKVTVKDTNLPIPITAELNKIACPSVSEGEGEGDAETCTGSGDPSAAGPLCYEGAAGALGLKETVTVKIESFAAEKGTLDLSGTGITAFTCASHSFSKSGQTIMTDLSDCLPNDVVLDGVKYCSDQDTLKVTVKDTNLPIPISAELKKITCPSVPENAITSCTGDGDPSVIAPRCYEGAAGALGLKETVNVKIESFAAEKGTLDLTGTGITAFTCASHSFSKSGQAIMADLSDCLPKDVVLDGVKYCSDQDTLKVTVKDTNVPIPITAELKKMPCPSDSLIV